MTQIDWHTQQQAQQRDDQRAEIIARDGHVDGFGAREVLRVLKDHGPAAARARHGELAVERVLHAVRRLWVARGEFLAGAPLPADEIEWLHRRLGIKSPARRARERDQGRERQRRFRAARNGSDQGQESVTRPPEPLG